MSKYSSTISLLQSEGVGAYYLLGALITDGNLTKEKVNTTKISISSKDKDWLDDINARLLDGEAFPRTCKRDNMHQLWLYNATIYDWLNEHECVENKSLIVKMPNVPTECLADFVRGSIDGDGSISSCAYSKKKNGKEYKYTQHVSYICSGSLAFLEGLDKRLHQFNIVGSLCEVKKEPAKLKNGKIIIPKNPHYRLTFSGKSAYNFVRFAYYPNHFISMNRKRLAANKVIDFYNSR